MKEIRGRGSVLLKKNWGKLGGYRLYSYIYKCNNNKILIHLRLNLDEAVCEYRLIFLLYVGAPDNVTQIARKLSTEHTEDTEIFVEDLRFLLGCRASPMRSPLKFFPEATYCCAFWSRILVKDSRCQRNFYYPRNTRRTRKSMTDTN